MKTKLYNCVFLQIHPLIFLRICGGYQSGPHLVTVIASQSVMPVLVSDTYHAYIGSYTITLRDWSFLLGLDMAFMKNIMKSKQ